MKQYDLNAMGRNLFLSCLPAVLFLVCGCSVKEDRELCPCRIVLDFSETDVSLSEPLDVRITDGKGFFFMDMVGADEFDREYVVEVPRGTVCIDIYSAAEGFLQEMAGLVIPPGKDCPPVYACSMVLRTVGREEVREIVRMRKNYCRMEVYVEDEGGFPYGLRVVGSVDGYEAAGKPSTGLFSYMMPTRDDGVFVVNLPRQKDSSLVLEVDDGAGVLKTFALGEYVVASGYDWTAADLDDITVGIDYAATHLSLTIDGWDKEYIFEVVI